MIELMMAVVVVGILVRMAIPKLAATKDAARLASVRADLLNAEIAQEAYFSDKSTYATLAASAASVGVVEARPVRASKRRVADSSSAIQTLSDDARLLTPSS